VIYIFLFSRINLFKQNSVYIIEYKKLNFRFIHESTYLKSTNVSKKKHFQKKRKDFLNFIFFAILLRKIKMAFFNMYDIF